MKFEVYNNGHDDLMKTSFSAARFLPCTLQVSGIKIQSFFSHRRLRSQHNVIPGQDW